MSKNKVQDPFVSPISHMKKQQAEHHSNYYRGRHRTVMLSSKISILSLASTSDVGWTNIDLTSYKTAGQISEDAFAVILYVEINDSGSSSADCSIFFRKDATTNTVFGVKGHHINDVVNVGQGIVEMHSNDVIEYIVDATGASTADVTVYIVGYIEQLS